MHRRELVSMIAVDTNVLVGAIKLSTLVLRTTARRAVPRRIPECLDAAIPEMVSASPDQTSIRGSLSDVLRSPSRNTGDFPNLAKICVTTKVSDT